MAKLEEAAFAAGCFWGVEKRFMEIPGVRKTEVGYTGGISKNPTYEDVCKGSSGHAETVHIKFDPGKISYKKLLEAFWELHDPTTPHRQGPNVGGQYRSVIFYYGAAQKEAAEKSLEDEQEKYGERKIVTEIVPASEFWKAEEYHQKYNQKHGNGFGLPKLI